MIRRQPGDVWFRSDLDEEFVIDFRDTRCRPRREFGVLSLGPRTDFASECHAAIDGLDGDLLRVQFSVSLERAFEALSRLVPAGVS